MMGSSSRCSSIRRKVFSMCRGVKITMERKMDTMMTTNRKLVPQRGWFRGWIRTFSTVRSRPFS